MRESVHRTAGARPKVPLVSETAPVAVSNRAIQTTLQRSLRVGRAGDRFEQEADAVADRVMQMPAPMSSRSQAREALQRQPVEEEEELLQSTPSDQFLSRQPEEEELLAKPGGGSGGVVLDAGTAAAISSARGSGSVLPSGVRSFFEPRLQRGFGDVRVHTGNGAAVLARRVNARAFTVGGDMFFGAQQWRPATVGGRRLIAHELTHVIQQRTGGSEHVRRQVLSTELTPEEEFLRDMQSGAQSANEYVGYIDEAIRYWQRHGVKPARLDDALENLAKITGTISRGLSRFGGVLGGVQRLTEVRRWYIALDEFRVAGRAFDPNDRESVRRWGRSMEQLRTRTDPFVEAARDWLGRIALRGSAAAARASLFFSVLSAYAEVGVATLNRGIENVNLYHERREAYLAEIERGPVQLPPEPSYPGPWTTTAERRVRARTFAEARRRQEARQREERERRAILRSFEAEEFPRIYRRHRRRLMRRIMRDMQRRRHPGTVTVGRLTYGTESIADRWWRPFTNSGESSYFDARVGSWVTPKALSTTREQRSDEIDEFRRVRPPCPYYDRLYQQSLAPYILRRQMPASQP
jgi:hypothetical protein